MREAQRVLPRVDAEEAVHEALVRAWRSREACRTPDTPLPWVLEITRNEARRLLAREARRSTRELVDVQLEPDADDGGRVDPAVRLTVADALGRLGEDDRRLLRLRYEADLTQVEIARRMRVPEGTVKVRLHRARRRLRALLEEAG